jgi:hypothetical protein
MCLSCNKDGHYFLLKLVLLFAFLLFHYNFKRDTIKDNIIQMICMTIHNSLNVFVSRKDIVFTAKMKYSDNI